MKKNIKYYGLLIIVLSVMFTSCNSDSSAFQNKQNKIALRGKALTEQLSEVYSSLNTMNNFFRYKKEYLLILTKNDSSLARLFKGITFDKNLLDSMQKIVENTRRVYKSYEMLTDITIGVEQSSIVQNIKLFYEGINKNNLSEDDLNLLESIMKASGAKKFERKNIIFGINTIMLNIITKDYEKQKNILVKFFDAYDKGLQKIPNSAFDYRKVENLVNEPYNDKDVVIGLYKLQLRNEAEQSKVELIGKIKNLIIATEKINTVHVELIKQKRDDEKIDKLISEIDLLLNYNEKQ